MKFDFFGLNSDDINYVYMAQIVRIKERNHNRTKYMGKDPVFSYTKQWEIDHPKCLGHHTHGIFEYFWESTSFDLNRKFHMQKDVNYNDSSYALYLIMSFDADHFPLKIHQVGIIKSTDIERTFNRVQKSIDYGRHNELIVLQKYGHSQVSVNKNLSEFRLTKQEVKRRIVDNRINGRNDFFDLAGDDIYIISRLNDNHNMPLCEYFTTRD